MLPRHFHEKIRKYINYGDGRIEFFYSDEKRTLNEAVEGFRELPENAREMEFIKSASNGFSIMIPVFYDVNGKVLKYRR